MRFYVLSNNILVIYQNDGQLIMEYCMQWNPKISALGRARTQDNDQILYVYKFLIV